MLDRFFEFTQALRDHGVPVAISQGVDALNALSHVPMEKRDATREALACTLVQSHGHREVFDTLFDLYFGVGATRSSAGPLEHPGFAGEEDRDAQEILDQVEAALQSGDGGALRSAAQAAVGRFGRIENSPSVEWYSHYQVMRAIDLDALVQRLEDQDLDRDGLDAVLHSEELRERANAFRAAALAETRRRVAEQRGPRAVADYAVGPLPEDADFFGLSTDVDAMRRAVRPLARRLATRVAMKRRRARRGYLDIRHTVRASLGSGGVPFEPRFKHRTPHRPELFVLCDVSGSVGRFARFTLMLTHALSSQFSRVRSFAFIDKLDEVTRFFEAEDFVAAVDRMNEEADLVWVDGHSDYGSSFEQFWNEYGRDLGPKTTLLILGDARTNYRTRRSEVLAAMHAKVHRAYWLNPEPKRDWDTGDSAAAEYAAQVDEMVEVRNLRQLEEFIARIL
ncbi:MAG: VWA domain-containing protein [Actinomycetota bacterium]|nr:VWA domain-containing protein [Actinomycetota bacterium]